MQTNFFSQLKNHNLKSVVLTIHFIEQDQAVVTVKPISKVDDPAIQRIPPMTINGNLSEIDSDFFQVIAKPMEKISGIIHNAEVFEAESIKAEKESKAEKSKQAKEAELKKKANDSYLKAKEIVGAEDFNYQDAKQADKALKLLKNTLELDKEHAKAKALLEEINLKQNIMTLNLK